MELLAYFTWINEHILALPTTILFLGVALFLTLKTKFAQIRSIPRFARLITHGVKKQQAENKTVNSLNSFHALFTAMGTTMGMGNVVGPSVAIFTGGPGALFWLVFYIFLGSVTKFTEVVFALITRETTTDGSISGGPVYYLKKVSPLLSYSYGFMMPLVLANWSSLQANTFASLLAQEGVPLWISGLFLAIFLAFMMWSGARHIASLASKLVPFMFVMYVSVALITLLYNPLSLYASLLLIKNSILHPAAAIGGFLGASMFHAIHAGLYQGIFISEAGLGTSSIPHSMANTDKPTDQGILAMCSSLSDMLLCTLSGLLVLTTGVWATGDFRSTFIYEAFSVNAPVFGNYILLASLALFIITTVMGNGFNGVQMFNALTGRRWTKLYIAFLVITVFAGALISVPLVWELTKTVIAIVAIPNLIGILILAIQYPQALKF